MILLYVHIYACKYCMWHFVTLNSISITMIMSMKNLPLKRRKCPIMVHPIYNLYWRFIMWRVQIHRSQPEVEKNCLYPTHNTRILEVLFKQILSLCTKILYKYGHFACSATLLCQIWNQMTDLFNDDRRFCHSCCPFLAAVVLVWCNFTRLLRVFKRLFPRIYIFMYPFIICMHNFTSDMLLRWFWANNEQIWLPSLNWNNV